MVLLVASNGTFRSPVRGKTVTLRDGTRATGDVIAARAGRFPEAAFWFIDETIRTPDGANHRCRLMSDSVRKIDSGLSLSALIRSMGAPPKPFILRFDSEERAASCAASITAVARAYADGRISVSTLAERSGPTTFIVTVEGVEGRKIFETESSALHEAEDAVASRHNTRVSVVEVVGVIPDVPLGRYVDFDEVKAWTKANLRVGMLLVLEETHGHMVTYSPVRVTSTPDRQGRFGVELPSESYAAIYGDPRFYVSGKLYQAPTGQSRLLPPLAEAVEMALKGGHTSAGRHYSFGVGEEQPPDLLKELSEQPTVPWTFRRPGHSGVAMLGAALASAAESPAEKTVKKLGKVGIKARVALVAGTDGAAAGDGDAEEVDAADAGQTEVIEAVQLAEMRGTKKQVIWANSIIAAFLKVRGLDRPGAAPTDDDEVVLGCTQAGLVIDHRDVLRAGDAAAFVAAIGARWTSFDGIGEYRKFATERLRSSSGKGAATAWHRHVVEVDGQDYILDAVGGEQWIRKHDAGRFAWHERDGKHHIIPGTLRTTGTDGVCIVRGKRMTKEHRAA